MGGDFLVSRRQTAHFSSFICGQTAYSSFIFGREEKRSRERALYNFYSQNPQFLGIYTQLLIGVKGKTLVDR